MRGAERLLQASVLGLGFAAGEREVGNALRVHCCLDDDERPSCAGEDLGPVRRPPRCLPGARGLSSTTKDPPMKHAQAQRLPRQGLEALDDEARVVVAIEEGLADIQAGRVVDDEELDEVLRARLGALID